MAAVFVPLRVMPLTPNGKIDKNKLPFPDTAALRQRLVEKTPRGTNKVTLPRNMLESRLVPLRRRGLRTATNG